MINSHRKKNWGTTVSLAFDVFLSSCPAFSPVKMERCKVGRSPGATGTRGCFWMAAAAGLQLNIEAIKAA